MTFLTKGELLNYAEAVRMWQGQVRYLQHFETAGRRGVCSRGVDSQLPRHGPRDRRMKIPKDIVADADLKKWTELGWVFSAPAFVKGFSVVCWLGDDKPRYPEDRKHAVR
jgi:hypothetical protein